MDRDDLLLLFLALALLLGMVLTYCMRHERSMHGYGAEKSIYFPPPEYPSSHPYFSIAVASRGVSPSLFAGGCAALIPESAEPSATRFAMRPHMFRDRILLTSGKRIPITLLCRQGS